MDYQKHDYELMTAIWKLFREYGYITNSDADSDRWSELLDKVEELNHKYPTARGLTREILFMLNERAVAANKGELKNA